MCKDAAPPQAAADASSSSSSALSLEQVQTYIKFRALDVIGSGTYRRHVTSSRERGEAWAMDVHEASLAVAAQVRSINTLVDDLVAVKKHALYALCQTVIENNTPPIDQPTVMADCSVSGKAKCQCIVLRSKGRGAPSVMVQSSFGHFILMLWTVVKMDIVIKSVTRDFLQSTSDRGRGGLLADESGDGARAEPSMRAVSEQFLQQQAKIHDLAVSIMHALEHVRNSLHAALLS